MTAEVVELHPDRGAPGVSDDAALAGFVDYLERCKLSDNTTKAYRRQATTYVSWLAHPDVDHPDAFVDLVGAEAAVTAWKRHLIARRARPATINQALAAVTLLYEHAAQLRIDVDRIRLEPPGEPDALTPKEQSRLERAAARRGARDNAIIATFLFCGPRVEESERLTLVDITVTARTGELRLHGKGDQIRHVPIPARARAPVRDWLTERGPETGPLWLGQRGPLTTSGLTQVVLAVGEDAGIPGLRPHRLRHTYATRLRQGGADPEQVRALLGQASLATTGRYFRAGKAERDAVVERIFE